MPWTTEQKIFIVEAYFRQKSIHTAQLQFKERFRCHEFPVLSMIYRWVNKFRTHGTVHNLNCKDTNRQSHSGRSKSSRTPHNVAAVRDCCPQPKQVCASAKSGAWNQPEVCADNFDCSSPVTRVVRVLQWFQQDGATPPHLKWIIGMATAAFPDRLISCRCDPQWSPHSPDLNLPDFYVRIPWFDLLISAARPTWHGKLTYKTK